jgi:hypothetical protein
MSDAAPKGAAADYLDQRWHRTLLDELCGFTRETASDGERAAANWLRERLASEVRIEEHRGHQTFWWPLGLAAAVGVLAGVRAIRGRSPSAAALAAEPDRIRVGALPLLPESFRSSARDPRVLRGAF